MRLKDAKTTYGVSSTYYYKLKTKANGDDNKFIELLKEYAARKATKANNTNEEADTKAE